MAKDTPFAEYPFVLRDHSVQYVPSASYLAWSRSASPPDRPRGERVLLVDLDPQAHATMGLGSDPDASPSPPI